MQQSESLGSLKDFLSKHGIGPSYQRLTILGFLMEHRIHPSVDEIYREIYKLIPTLSKTTVYNTLNLFAEHNIVRVLTINDNETRYDIDTSNHVHFKCDRCGKIYDIFTEAPFFQEKVLEGHHIREEHVYLKGICKECVKEEDYVQ